MSKWQKWQPFIKNSDGNAYPRVEMGVIDLVIMRVWMPYRKLWGAFRGAENRTPEHEIASKMRPLKQKVCVEMAKMATLRQK